MEPAVAAAFTDKKSSSDYHTVDLLWPAFHILGSAPIRLVALHFGHRGALRSLPEKHGTRRTQAPVLKSYHHGENHKFSTTQSLLNFYWGLTTCLYWFKETKAGILRDELL